MKVGTSSVMIGMEKGDVVTFTYEASARRELPVHPKIIRKRVDLSWADVLISYANEHRFLNEGLILDRYAIFYLFIHLLFDQ